MFSSFSNYLVKLFTSHAPKPSLAPDAEKSKVFRPAAGTIISNPTDPVLFLDFDGVLHPGDNPTFQLMPHLEDVLLVFPDLEIVISISSLLK